MNNKGIRAALWKKFTDSLADLRIYILEIFSRLYIRNYLNNIQKLSDLLEGLLSTRYWTVQN